jgi:hypothetical protein
MLSRPFFCSARWVLEKHTVVSLVVTTHSLWVDTHVLEEHDASIFSVQPIVSQSRRPTITDVKMSKPIWTLPVFYNTSKTKHDVWVPNTFAAYDSEWTRNVTCKTTDHEYVCLSQPRRPQCFLMTNTKVMCEGKQNYCSFLMQTLKAVNNWQTAHVYRWDIRLEWCRLVTSIDIFMSG